MDDEKKVFAVESNGIQFNVRIVAPGDQYGRNDVLTNESSEEMVEFYDTRYQHTELGQFVSRYYASTLRERENRGLCLDGGVPAWNLDEKAFGAVRDWLEETCEAPVRKRKPLF